MTTVTFDTMDLVAKLRASGVPQEQAEAMVRAIAESQGELVKKNDLDTALAPIRTDLAVLKWMMGILLAGVLSLVLKAYF